MTQKEKIFQLKLDALKKYGEASNMEYKISESGNHYIVKRGVVTKLYDSHNITKNIIGKIGEAFSYPTTQTLILLNEKGKFLTKNGSGFKNLSRHEYPELWFIGKKSEWVLNHKELIHIRIATQFNSFKEFKNYLGFDFISCEEFINSFKDQISYAVSFYNRSKDEKVNIISLLKKDIHCSYINDCINMAQRLSCNITIPKGKESIKELHDTLTVDFYKLQNKLIEYDVILENFFTSLFYRIIKSNHELKVRGGINKHCIGSYDYLLHKDLFLVIDDKYDCHIVNRNGVWVVSQIKGFSNSDAPIEITNEINEALKSCKVTIQTITIEDVIYSKEEAITSELLPF